jgi:hypothetical protein
MSNASVYTGNNFFNESEFESAFDAFNLRQCVSDDIIWYLPKLLKKFLIQTEISKSKACEKQLMNLWKNNNRKFKHNKQDINLTNFVKIDQNCHKSEILIFIMSNTKTSGEALNKREVARKTWVAEAIKYNITVFFVFAETENNNTQRELEEESLKYNDIIQFGFIDNYYNLTLKQISVLRWVRRKCSDSKYILKADDDVLVNIDNLNKNLQFFENGIFGCMCYQLRVVRDKDSKWFMPDCIYQDEFYPKFITGSSYLMTKDTSNKILTTLENYSGPIIDLEDVFLTGIIPNIAGIERFDSDNFRFTYDCDNKTDACLMFNTTVLINCPHNNNMIQFWNKWKETSPESCNLTATL